jgi:hypothetical protein
LLITLLCFEGPQKTKLNVLYNSNEMLEISASKKSYYTSFIMLCQPATASLDSVTFPAHVDPFIVLLYFEGPIT